TWHPDTMPTPTEYSPSATLNSSSVTDQSPGFSSAYTTSPLSTNCSPREQLLPPTLGPTTKPTPTDASPPKKKRQQRRRTKANPGNRACDKKKRDRKNNKNVQCMFCPKMVSDNRDRTRHHRAKHREEAAKIGVDMRRISGTGNRTLGSAVLFPQVMRARNVSHYTIPDSVLVAERGSQTWYYDRRGWHEGQYACGQCKAVFASAPPLERHGRDSGHAIEWYCDDEECEMAGTPFETYRIYLEHFRLSPAHQDDAESEEIIDALGNTDVVVPSQDQQDDNSPSQLVTSDIFACREPCCQRYGFNFRCISEYNRHANVSYHMSAAKLNQALVDSMQPGPALAAEQEAIRNLRCNAPGCLSYEGTFSGFQGFFSHITGAEHRQAWTVVSGTCFLDEHESPTLPGIVFDAGGASGECANKNCPKYGTFFNSFWKLKQHAHSFAHATTEEDMDSTDESSQEVWVSSDLEGIEVTKNKAFWRCAQRGCRMFGNVYNHRSNARLHTTSFSHTSAEAFLGEVWVSSEFEGMEVKGMEFKGMTLWKCVKRGCRRYGSTMAPSGKARKHANSVSHTTADPDVPISEFEGMEVKGMAFWKCVKRGCRKYGQTMTPSNDTRKHANSVSHTTADPDVPMSPETPTTPFATPKRAPEAAFMTPMNLDTPVPDTPLSPSAGRGSSAAMTLVTPTKTPTSLRMPPSRATIKLRRSSNTSSQVKRRQDDLERRNQELEDRVKRLE
ncbi:uncharacterized protein NECHADRAFT_21043, partial [Fusarium vanettenii 77-13-4]